MKIPETSANVGAYYGNEENGQWQPNGVIIDSGPGGGVVGSGDAGHHRPVYPVHVPRPHIPGYVVGGPGAFLVGGGAGAAPLAPAQDFADYMWMEHEEEFDKQVMQQLEEEALMEQCIEAMLEDEQREQRHRPHNGHAHYPTTSNERTGGSLSLEETVSRSTLNPLAAEFVPTRRAPEDKPSSPAEDSPEPAASAEHRADTAEETSAEAPPETPEVSAADITTDKKRDKKEAKKQAKTEAKPEQKKTKPQVVKSETKVQSKSKEVKTVKSEVKVEEKLEDTTTEATKVIDPLPVPTEDPSVPKPINYAAAARTTKPKKTAPAAVTAAVTAAPDKKKDKPKEKPRKNSAK